MKLYNVIDRFETFCHQTVRNRVFTYFNKNKAIQAGNKLATIRKVPFYEQYESGIDDQIFIEELETNDELEIN